MITIETNYIGDLRAVSRHLRSGVELITDAPPDNQGKGESFSPTDLLATALGTCMITVMGIAAKKHQINIDGTKLEITKIMQAAPRKVMEIKVTLFMPAIKYSNNEKEILEHAGTTCPVALSLHPELKQSIEFIYNH
ncbi:MAG: OsmC family protein [Bacteroidota bacterium]